MLTEKKIFYLVSFFSPNTDSIDNFYGKGKYTLAWRLALFFTLTFSLLTFISLTHPNKESIIYSLCSVIGVSTLLFLSKTNKYKFVYYFISISGSLIVFYTINYFNTLIHFGDFLWIIVIIIFSFFGLGLKYGLIILIVNIFTIIILQLLFSININLENISYLTDSQRIIVTIDILGAVLSISYIVYQFVVFHNYSYNNLKERNTIISAQNNEKTTLVKEIHHRVKNNLQIVVSLLRLQKGELQSNEAKRHFNEAINRIMVMSLIHKKLYQEAEMANIDIKPYLTDLSKDVIQTSNIGAPIKFNISSEIERIGLKTIVPLGLLINELLSNSIKHAFKKEGHINISIIKGSGGNFKLIYTDNGYLA